MLLAAPLIDLPAAYRLLSAMPSGLNSMVVAHAYGLDMEITAEAVTWSTAIVVAAALLSLLVLMLHHVGIEVAPADIERPVELWRAARLRAGRAAAGARRVHLAGTRRDPDPPDADRVADRARRAATLAVVVADFDATRRRACASRLRGRAPAANTGARRAPRRSPPAATGSS